MGFSLLLFSLSAPFRVSTFVSSVSQLFARLIIITERDVETIFEVPAEQLKLYFEEDDIINIVNIVFSRTETVRRTGDVASISTNR